MGRVLKDEVIVDCSAFLPGQEHIMSNRWMTALTVSSDKAGVSRHDIIDALAVENVDARPVWKPVHLQRMYEGMPYYSNEEGNKRLGLFI